MISRYIAPGQATWGLGSSRQVLQCTMHSPDGVRVETLPQAPPGWHPASAQVLLLAAQCPGAFAAGRMGQWDCGEWIGHTQAEIRRGRWGFLAPVLCFKFVMAGRLWARPRRRPHPRHQALKTSKVNQRSAEQGRAREREREKKKNKPVSAPGTVRHDRACPGGG